MSMHFTNHADSPESRNGTLENMTAEELMLKVQGGNSEAFTVLFDRYHRLVLVTALRIVRDVAEAEEVTQNVFFEIYQSARNFDPARGNLKVWLLQYAYHRSVNRRNYLLLRQFYNRLDLDEALCWEDSANMAPRYPAQELTQLIREALKGLNEPQRRTIQKVFFEGLTLKEVAEQTNESFSNVRNHYYRGLGFLRAYMASEPTAHHKSTTLPFGEVSRVKA
jgi:RNA polymerase sigma-70 factor, ECF subfamily